MYPFREFFPPYPDIQDQLQVFVYTNLSTMIAPHQEVLLRRSFRAALTTALNDVGERHNIELPNDLKDILDIFIITQLPQRTRLSITPPVR